MDDALEERPVQQDERDPDPRDAQPPCCRDRSDEHDEECTPQDGRSREPRQWREQRQDDRRIEERQRRARAGGEGLRLIWLTPRQPPVCRPERDLDVDPEVRRANQCEVIPDRQEDQQHDQAGHGNAPQTAHRVSSMSKPGRMSAVYRQHSPGLAPRVCSVTGWNGSVARRSGNRCVRSRCRRPGRRAAGR